MDSTETEEHKIKISGQEGMDSDITKHGFDSQSVLTQWT